MRQYHPSDGDGGGRGPATTPTAVIIRDMPVCCWGPLRPRLRRMYSRWTTPDAKFTSDVFRAFSPSAWTRVSLSARHTSRTPTPRWSAGANGVISDMLRTYDTRLRRPSGTRLTPHARRVRHQQRCLAFFIDRGAHPRLPLSPPHDDRGTCKSPTQYVQQMWTMESTVRELLAAAQAERKGKLDTGRVDTVFQVGDLVLLRTKELPDAADFGKLRPRLDGPCVVTACPSPNAYTLTLQHKMRCSPTVNVDRLTGMLFDGKSVRFGGYKFS